MHSLGISVYPDKSDIKEVYEYMETAAKLGFSRIFTCFLSIPDDKRESYLKEFKGFMDKAHELGFVVAADTNPEVFKLIGATPKNSSLLSIRSSGAMLFVWMVTLVLKEISLLLEILMVLKSNSMQVWMLVLIY